MYVFVCGVLYFWVCLLWGLVVGWGEVVCYGIVLNFGVEGL